MAWTRQLSWLNMTIVSARLLGIDRKVRAGQLDNMAKKIFFEPLSLAPVHSRPQTFMNGRTTVSARPGGLPFSFIANLQPRMALVP